MLQTKIFVFELGAVNAFTARAVLISKIATLYHKIGHHPMKWTVLIAETLLAGAQGFKVFFNIEFIN